MYNITILLECYCNILSFMCPLDNKEIQPQTHIEELPLITTGFT